MRRRDFIAGIAGSSIAWPLAVRAQQPAASVLIGALLGLAESDPVGQSVFAAFRAELGKLGWTEGSNLRIVTRWAAGNADRIRTFAKELVELKPDAIFSPTPPRPLLTQLRPSQRKSIVRPLLKRDILPCIAWA
jgi:putative ABC transport system substrate-binding protein